MKNILNYYVPTIRKLPMGKIVRIPCETKRKPEKIKLPRAKKIDRFEIDAVRPIPLWCCTGMTMDEWADIKRKED